MPAQRLVWSWNYNGVFYTRRLTTTEGSDHLGVPLLTVTMRQFSSPLGTWVGFEKLWMHLDRLTHADISLLFILDRELGISKQNIIPNGFQVSAAGKKLF